MNKLDYEKMIDVIFSKII